MRVINILLVSLLLMTGSAYAQSRGAALQSADGTAISASNPLPVTFGTGDQIIDGTLYANGGVVTGGNGAHNIEFDGTDNYIDGDDVDGTVYVSNNLMVGGAYIGNAFNSLFFDGAGAANDFVVIPRSANNDFFGATSYSVESWVYARSAGEGTAGTIFTKADSTTTMGGTLRLTTGNAVVGLIHCDASNKISTTTTTVPIGTWSHVVMTWASGGRVNIYINGVEASYSGTPPSCTTPTDDTSRNIYIGNSVDTTRTFDGNIRLVRVFRNTQLSAASVLALYEKGRPFVQNESSSVTGISEEFNFVVGSGTSLIDVITGNNGSISGATWVPTSSQIEVLDKGNISLSSLGYVGIGTVSPAATLDIGGGTATYIDGVNDLLVKDDVEVDGEIYTTGNVGVGTLPTAYKFEVSGGTTVGDFWVDTANKAVNVGRFSTIASDGSAFNVRSRTNTIMFNVNTVASTGYFKTTNLGVGTSNPVAALDVSTTSAKTYVDGTNDIYLADDIEIDGNLYVGAGTVNYAFSTGDGYFSGKLESDGGIYGEGIPVVGTCTASCSMCWNNVGKFFYAKTTCP